VSICVARSLQQIHTVF